MFEIGSSLRLARERRGLELSDVERATRIRSKYLKALEDERFELIPGLVYAKGFLRTYANHLGLDGERFAEELASRLPADEEEASLHPVSQVVSRRRVSPTLVVGVLVVATIGILVALLGTTTRPKPRAAPPAAPPPARTGALGTRHVVSKPHPEQRVRVVLRASGGRCWIEAHAGSRTGRRLYYSTLEEGRSLRLTQRRIWLRVGAPLALSATLDGNAVTLPQTQSPVDLLVTPRGVAPA